MRFIKCPFLSIGESFKGPEFVHNSCSLQCYHFKVGMASKTLGGAGGVLPLPEKALSESMEKGGRKMQGEIEDR